MSPAMKAILELAIKEFAEKVIEIIEDHLGSNKDNSIKEE